MSQIHRLEQALTDVIPEGEVLVHYDVLIKTRSGPDLAEIHSYRISMPGSDPDLTLGTLLRAAGVVLTPISPLPH